MYSTLAASKAAVISVAEEISSQGLPSGICPLVFVFTGSGNGTLSFHIILFQTIDSFSILKFSFVHM